MTKDKIDEARATMMQMVEKGQVPQRVFHSTMVQFAWYYILAGSAHDGLITLQAVPSTYLARTLRDDAESNGELADAAIKLAGWIHTKGLVDPLTKETPQFPIRYIAQA